MTILIVIAALVILWHLLVIFSPAPKPKPVEVRPVRWNLHTVKGVRKYR
jgi:hypothetical protein